MFKPIRLLRYGVAILSVALALVLTLLLKPLLAPTILPLFFLAVTFSTWYGGRDAGIVAIFLSVLATRYFLLPPIHSFWPIPSATIAQCIVFGAVTMLLDLQELDLQALKRSSQSHLRELERTEAILRESDARFRAAAEGSFDAIFILKSVRDRTGEIIDFQIVDLNRNAAKLISMPQADVLGQYLCELLPINRTQGFFEKYRQVVETGIALEEEFPRHPTSTVTAAWLHHQVVPLGDGIAITTRDITERKQSEDALKASELLYRTLAEAMPQLVWTQDPEGNVEYVNSQWQRTLGTTTEEVARNGWEHLVHPEDVAKLLTKEDRSVREGTPREAEFRYRMADGSYRWFLGRCVPIKNDRGDIVKWVGTSTDVDDLKRYEQELARHKQQFQTLAENSPDIISRVDRNLRHIYVNSAIAQATGLSPERFIGKTHDDLGIPDHLRRKWQTRLRQVIATGQSDAYEFSFPAPDGIRYYLSRVVPEFDAAGQVESVLGITSDITQFKRVEQSLRDSEWRFRRVMESNMIGMGFWSATGEIADANDALLDLLGYTREEFLAEQPRWIDLTPSEYVEADQRALEEIGRTGICTPFEKEYIRRDGARVPIVCGGASFANTTRSGVFFVLDLSDRKQIEKERDRLLQLERAARAEAEAANRIKDEFLMVLSHELRTPLNPILGWAKLLQTRQFTSGMVAHALETIERNARQQAQLVEDLLDVSRILQGKLNLNWCPVNLIDVVNRAISSVNLSAQAKAITIETQFNTPIATVMGSQERLQQVIWNLLFNAVKFTPHGGRVSVYLETVDQYLQVCVADTGQGIEASFMPYVFDYFRQFDSTLTRSTGGLGLGLAIARHLVELHGGTLEAASEGAGKGSTFTIQLPLPPQATEPIDPFPACALPGRVLKETKVLLAGAADDIQELIAILLTQAGATVRLASSTATVLEELAHGTPHVLVGTVELLQDNDYELMHRLRLWSQEFGEDIPVVALATHADEVAFQEARANGLQHIFSISMEPDALLGAIAQAIPIP